MEKIGLREIYEKLKMRKTYRYGKGQIEKTS
jgi:hypothetical protein